MRYSEFKTQKEFKKFLRENDLTVAEYFEKYESKNDLFTNEKLNFKYSGKYPTKSDIEKYFLYDFRDKRHMAKWLDDQYKDAQREYILKKLNYRAKEKEWIHAPSQVECRSLREIPALNVIDYCNDEKLWKEFGLNRKYQYIDFKPRFETLNNTILAIDTREQKPLKIENSKIIKLAFGDYCFIEEPYFCNVFIERKSIQDLWGTMSQGYDRFQREIERAASQNGYIIVVVDYLFSKAQSYNYNKKYSKASSEFIFHRIRELMQKYENVQFVFSGGRKQSVELIKKIGLLGEKAKTIDLQYALDMKKI